jgi:hypothetical protein
MKALLSRVNRALGRKDSQAPPPPPPADKEHKQLPQWPPQAPHKPLPDPSYTPASMQPPPSPTKAPARESSQTTTATATTTAAHTPSGSSDDHHHAPPRVQITPNTPLAEPADKSSRRTTGTVREEKKVAFRSPPPSPGPEAALAQQVAADAGASTVSLSPPLKTAASRFASQHGQPEARGSTSTQASSSRAQVGGSNSRATGSTVRLAGTTGRGAPSPFPRGGGDGASMHPSMRSNTPYSQAGSPYPSEILAVTSWSEAAEDDLVSNLGPRERTRQEVLWEIVASEERSASRPCPIRANN